MLNRLSRSPHDSKIPNIIGSKSTKDMLTNGLSWTQSFSLSNPKLNYTSNSFIGAKSFGDLRIKYDFALVNPTEKELLENVEVSTQLLSTAKLSTSREVQATGTSL